MNPDLVILDDVPSGLQIIERYTINPPYSSQRAGEEIVVEPCGCTHMGDGAPVYRIVGRRPEAPFRRFLNRCVEHRTLSGWGHQ